MNRIYFAFLIVLLLLAFNMGCANPSRKYPADNITPTNNTESEEARNKTDTDSDVDHDSKANGEEKNKARSLIKENEAKIERNKKQILSQKQALLETENSRTRLSSQISNCNANLERAQQQLINAQKEKKRVYRAGIGWTYESDQAAISSANQLVKQYQDQLYSLKNEMQNLDRTYALIQSEISQLDAENSRLQTENTQLRRKFNLSE